MPYTSTLTLSYLFGSSGDSERLPDLRLRAYHDARLLEAEEFQAEHKTRGRASARGNVNCISAGRAT